MNFESIYLPPEGKYKPTTVPGGSSCGYPWQHNPLLHKCTSEPYFCKNKHVFRRYGDNRTLFTRTRSQVAAGIFAYYVYDEHNRLIETGELELPNPITDGNWCHFQHKDNKRNAAFINGLHRTNIMRARYRYTPGLPANMHPLQGIWCYTQVAAGTPLTDKGAYQTDAGSIYYSFGEDGKTGIDVSITLLSYTPIPQPVKLEDTLAVTPPASLQHPVLPQDTTLQHSAAASIIPLLPTLQSGVTEVEDSLQTTKQHGVLFIPLIPICRAQQTCAAAHRQYTKCCSSHSHIADKRRYGQQFASTYSQSGSTLRRNNVDQLYARPPTATSSLLAQHTVSLATGHPP